MIKLNRYEKKIIKGIIENRRGIYETPKRPKALGYKPCKEYDAALSLLLLLNHSLDGSLVDCINLMLLKGS